MFFQVLIIREKLADLYESEQQWSKAAQMLSGIDLDSGMRCGIVFFIFYNKIRYSCSLSQLRMYSFCFISARVIDDTFRLSKCVQIARLYLEVLTSWCNCIFMLKRFHLVHANMNESCHGVGCRPVVNGCRYFILKRIVLQTGVCVSDQQSLHLLLVYFFHLWTYTLHLVLTDSRIRGSYEYGGSESSFHQQLYILQDDDAVNAEAFINKASFLVSSSQQEVLNLQYKVWHLSESKDGCFLRSFNICLILFDVSFSCH